MKEILMTGAMAVTLLAQGTGRQANVAPGAGGANVPPASQTIPDAPRPQTQGIGPVAPGKGAAASSSASTVGGDAAAGDTQQPAVGSTLPGSAPSTPPAGSAMNSDDAGPPPELPAAGEGSKVFTYRTGVTFVDVPFTVKDSKGRLVPGLTWRDVRIYENGLRQQMRVFTVDPFPLSVALVIDQSMPFDVMTRVNNALGALQGAFSAYDEVAVFTYNNGPRMQTDFTAGQSAKLAAVVERSKSTGREPMYYNAGEALSRGIDLNNGAQDHINPLTSGGPGSPQGLSGQQVPREAHTLNDAILEAAKATTRAGKGRRRIVYVISDGKEYGSQAKTKDVIKYLQTNKIAVYATLVGDSAVAGMGFVNHVHLPLTMRDNLLPVYTAATGGQFYAEYRTKGIETSFAEITEQVRTQYTVGYTTSESPLDGKFRSIEVRVSRPNLEVIAKKGYYPNPQDVPPAAVRPTANP